MTKPSEFGTAKWIWAGFHEYDLVNSYAQFRRVFTLKAAVKKALIDVTADMRYRLFVNGRHVCRGPARGFQRHWPYDTVDIAPFLRKGRNVIAAVAHNAGIGTFQYAHDGSAGFLLSGRVGREDISSSCEWKARRAPGWREHTARAMTPHQGFQEHFDARDDDESWLKPGYDDSAWQKAVGRSFGAMPWHSVEKRGIPMMREEIMAPVKMVSEAQGSSARGAAGAEDLVTLYCSEKPAWKTSAGKTTRRNGWIRFDVPPSGRERYTAFCLDFGKEVVGAVRLKAEGAEGGEILDALTCEALDGPKPIIYFPVDAHRIAFGDRLILKKGATEHEQFDIRGFRYLVIMVRENRRRIRLSVGLRWTAYPLDVTASFRSSNHMLNRIYGMSAWTQQCCMLDAYVDCPWREQAQWWGDARVQGANTFFLSADERLFRRGIRQIGATEVPNGLTYAFAPSEHPCILPDYTLTWVITHHDYYLQTGDLSLFSEMRERVHRAMDYFAGMTDRNGLLPHDGRYWLFLDWCGVFKDGYPALYNLFYLMALRAASKLFGLARDRKSAGLYAERARTLQAVIEKRLFDRRRFRLHGGLDRRNRPAGKALCHEYALAVLLDLFPEAHNRFLEAVILPEVRGAPVAQRTPSPFFMYYVFEAMKKLGAHADVVDCVHRWWGRMADDGISTTQESWEANPGKGSLCHAWSAHPVVHLSNILLGIWQAEPGWKSIRYEPVFTHATSAEGGVATPFGVVRSSWRMSGNTVEVSLNLPEGVRAEVVLPNIRKKNVAGKGAWKIRLPE
ncbi:MAG: alpha-L-rhamnosidase N-terminal domain-containing protein [Planctomycetes bacterium]|nr:alpha-L-rhamnosidase N-terminal domain-containing protein [Planctomycetota bacterium]